MPLPLLECTYYATGKCFVCKTIQDEYDIQLKNKETKLRQHLQISPNQVLLTQRSPHKGFRDKMKLQVSGSFDQPLLGFLDPHELVVKEPIEHCPLHSPNLNQFIPQIKKIITLVKLPPYNIQTRQGELKGIICFYSPTTHQSYIRFILRSKEALDRLKKNASHHLSADVISANIQPIAHALLEGPEEILIKGEYIIHRFNEHSLQLSTQGFVQTNTFVAQALYHTASEWLDEYELDTLCDVYCGHGPFLFHVENNARHSLGLEINESAVKRANSTSQQFNRKSRFIHASSLSLPEHLIHLAPDAVIVNPPRAGLGQFASILLQLNPKLILYSSCNLETLAVDIEGLKTNYEIKKAQLFDMFPHSEHFEVLVLLERR